VVGWGEVGVFVECLGKDLWYQKGKGGDETCVSEGVEIVSNLLR
jgi:hypothetical protein